MKVKLIVDGGNMKPGPAVAQQLGPMGINLNKVIEDVNKETQGFKGMKVPVELDVDATTKKYTIEVFSPPVSELLKKELGLEKAAGDSSKFKVGNLAIEDIIKIAKTKQASLLAKDLKAAVKLVLGSCVSLGILVESEEPRKVSNEIMEGKYNKEIKEEKTEPSEEKRQKLKEFWDDLSDRQEKSKKALEEAKAAEEAKKTEDAAKTVAPEETDKKEEKQTAEKKKK